MSACVCVCVHVQECITLVISRELVVCFSFNITHLIILANISKAFSQPPSNTFNCHRGHSLQASLAFTSRGANRKKIHTSRVNALPFLLNTHTHARTYIDLSVPVIKSQAVLYFLIHVSFPAFSLNKQAPKPQWQSEQCISCKAGCGLLPAQPLGAWSSPSSLGVGSAPTVLRRQPPGRAPGCSPHRGAPRGPGQGRR